ncbi:MAG: PH domain-containing protein [Lactobacillus sp.]|jgi:hypothetical protein|nr:PH domain-containing protein [Lactobacillus sp.]MCI2033585.1 PH domain-containing protein [Lactobacillus sp.]
MNFCPQCGAKLEPSTVFCPQCGFKVGDAQAQTQSSTPTPEPSEMTIAEWSTWLMGLEGKSKKLAKGIDVSLPQFNYKLTNQRILAEKRGVLSTDRQEIELYNVKDVAAKQTLTEKVMGVGEVTVFSADTSTPDLVMKRIKDPIDIKEKIRTAAREAKSQMNVHYRQDI